MSNLVNVADLDEVEMRKLRGVICSLRRTGGVDDDLVWAYEGLSLRFEQLSRRHTESALRSHAKTFSLSSAGVEVGEIGARFVVNPSLGSLDGLVRHYEMNGGKFRSPEVRCCEVSPGHLGFVVDAKQPWAQEMFREPLEEWAALYAEIERWIADVKAGGFETNDFLPVGAA